MSSAEYGTSTERLISKLHPPAASALKSVPRLRQRNDGAALRDRVCRRPSRAVARNERAR